MLHCANTHSAEHSTAHNRYTQSSCWQSFNFSKTCGQTQITRTFSLQLFTKEIRKAQKQQATALKSTTVKCAYCKLTNHTISECRKLKQKLANEKQSVAHGHCNMYVSPGVHGAPVVNAEHVKDTDSNSVHPLFTPYC